MRDGEYKLPVGWGLVTLGDVRRGVSASVNPAKSPSQIYELYSVPQFTDGVPEVVVGATIGSNKQVVVGGTVLLCKINPRINRVWVVRESAGSVQIASTEWIAFWPVQQATPSYLCYFMQQGKFRDFLAANVSGVGGSLMRVRPQAVIGYQMPLAPLAEQRRIVAKIEELFSDLDAGVAALERVKANLKRYRAAVLKAAVEGKLTAEWRKKNPATETGEQLLKRILAERQRKWEEVQLKKFAEKEKSPPKGWREKYQEPESPDVAGLAALPEGWCWTTVGGVGAVKGGIQKQPIRRPVANAFPYLRVANVFRDRLDLRDVGRMELFGGELEALRLESGDLLIVEGNGSKSEIGRCAIWRGEIDCCVHQNHIIRVRICIASPQFINTYWNSPSGICCVLDKAASTSGLFTLSVAKVSAAPVPLPPLAEQRQVVAEVERRLSVADAVAIQVEHSLKRAARLRQAILKRAFEGKLVAQNAADEPASVLLERIRSQRAAVPERLREGQKRVGTPAVPGEPGQVVPLVARPARLTRKGRKLSQKIWLARATIAAYGVQALADQPTFGRVQLQKFLYLAQAHIGLDLQFEFEKQAAGPFDKDLYVVEATAGKKRWFSFTGARGDATHYHPGVKIQERLTWAGRMFKKQLPAIDRLIGHLRGMNTDQAELFATIHAVWGELLRAGKPCGEEEIVKGVYAWHESKKRFTVGVIRERVKWMRGEGYVPAARSGVAGGE